jgi:hypothetical protein
MGKKKPVRERAKGRIRFGLSLTMKRPRYRGVVKFFSINASLKINHNCKEMVHHHDSSGYV